MTMRGEAEPDLLTGWPRYYGTVYTGSNAAPVENADGPRALWIGDDCNSGCDLDRYFSGKGYVLDWADNFAMATQQLQKTWYQLVLIDLDLLDAGGLSLIRDTHRHWAGEFVVVTGHGSVRTVVEALRYPVFGCLMKPVAYPELGNLLARIGHAGSAGLR